MWAREFRSRRPVLYVVLGGIVNQWIVHLSQLRWGKSCMAASCWPLCHCRLPCKSLTILSITPLHRDVIMLITFAAEFIYACCMQPHPHCKILAGGALAALKQAAQRFSCVLSLCTGCQISRLDVTVEGDDWRADTTDKQASPGGLLTLSLCLPTGFVFCVWILWRVWLPLWTARNTF